MNPHNSRKKAALIIVLCLLPMMGALAQQHKKNDEKPIQVINTVSNHNFIEFPGGEFPLPRILIVNGHWYFYWSTHKAIQSGNFIMKNGNLVPTGGGTISLDLSITSHLVYL